MKSEQELIEMLEKMNTSAPQGFAEQVMDALPKKRTRSQPVVWPTRGQWLAPAFVGAMAMLLIVFTVGRLGPPHPAAEARMTLHFELHAPGADRVELLGTFNDWQPGDIVLNGPDASGHWTADVALPEGRHEYIFLVDGKTWLADPNGATHRPDGFGRENTVIKVYDDNNI